MTVREMVRLIQRELRNEDVTPTRGAELLTTLTALLGNINDEIRQADMDYATVLLSCLESEDAASRAKIKAEISPEYQRKREARDTKELAVEMIRSLKYVLKAKAEEMRLTQ